MASHVRRKIVDYQINVLENTCMLSGQTEMHSSSHHVFVISTLPHMFPCLAGHMQGSHSSPAQWFGVGLVVTDSEL